MWTLQGCTLYKDNSWHTLCLPFSMTAAQVAEQLASVKLKELDIAPGDYEHTTGIDGNTLYLNFKDATSIHAGKPYIIKWKNGTDVSNPTFSDVTINNTVAVGVVSNDFKLVFSGIYAPMNLTMNDKSNMYLAANNQLTWAVDEDFCVKAFNAYFHLVSTQVDRCVLNFGDEMVTIDVSGIKDIESALRGNSLTPWYTIDGRRLSRQPTKSGLYINEGRKVILAH